MPSGFLQGVFARFGMRAEVLPNAVDVERFVPRGRAFRPDAPHFIVTRNLEAIYDNETALRAFALVRARCPDARLTLAGEGPELARLQALAAALDVTAAVRFAGRLGREQVAALYADADVMINPSRVDNTPNSVLESLACGVPVVSTRVGGVPFLVEHGRTALLVPPADSEAMAQALLHLLDHPDTAATLRAEGLAHVAQFAWSSVRIRIENAYRSVLPATPAGGASG